MKKDKDEYPYVVAIDFGTTRTGFAWAIRGMVSSSSDQTIRIREDWPGCPTNYPKTYSDLVFCEEKIYYGGEAHKIIVEGKDLAGHLKKPNKIYRMYKMQLYAPSQEQDKDLESVIMEELRFMKEEAYGNMHAHMPQFNRTQFDTQVQWVLTVPEGATDENKAFMRRAAQKVGLVGEGEDEFDRLLFALEPEAAIISYMKESDFDFQFGEKDSIIVVYDAGGGTVDVSVKEYRKDERGKFHSISGIEGSCRDAGSGYTDHGFWKYLGGLFLGTKFQEYLGHLLENDRETEGNVLKEWLEAKENTSVFKEGDSFSYSIDISGIWEIFEEYSKEEYDALRQEIVENGGEIIRGKEHYKFDGRKNKYLEVNDELFRRICAPVFKSAYLPLKKVLGRLEERGRKCDFIFFAGGFSCNPCLRKYIKEQIKVDFKESPSFVTKEKTRMGSAVLSGAVLFGMNPGIIADRIVKRAYGVKSRVNGNDNGFTYLVKKGEIVSFDHEKVCMYSPVHADQTKVCFRFYATDNNNVETIDDWSLEELKTETIESPDTTGGTERKIPVTLEFGRSETTVTIRDENTGNVVKTSLCMTIGWSD